MNIVIMTWQIKHVIYARFDTSLYVVKLLIASIATFVYFVNMFIRFN